MPEPHRNESKPAFIKRAIRFFVEEEKRPQKQAIAMAHAYWERFKGKGKKK